MVEKIIKIVLGLLGAVLGYYLGLFLIELDLFNRMLPSEGILSYGFQTFMGIILGIITFLLAPWLIKAVLQMVRFFEGMLQKVPVPDLVGGSIGLTVGLIIANLLGAPLARLPWVGFYIPIITSLLFGYLGLSMGIKKREEFLNFFTLRRLGGKQRGDSGNYKILDTNVVIDGRISDIYKSGFLDGILIVPRFVLEELQHIADSADMLRRNKGRRGLDILNNMRKEQGIRIEIRGFEDFEGDVDSRLVRVAKLLGAPIVTNDFNLNKVAELEGVKVLNINELSNAVKPLYLPGEEISSVDVIRDGKEVGQGVAYLDDGTMIVIEGGKKYVGQNLSVIVTSVLQTAAGRMIFARPKGRKENSSRQCREVNFIG